MTRRFAAVAALALLALAAALPTPAAAAPREVWRERGAASLGGRRTLGVHRAPAWHGRPSLYHRNPTYYPRNRAGSR